MLDTVLSSGLFFFSSFNASSVPVPVEPMCSWQQIAGSKLFPVSNCNVAQGEKKKRLSGS